MIRNLANAQRKAMGPLGKSLGLIKNTQRCKFE